MKKSLLALALFGAYAGAQAQSSATVYGTLDAGLVKSSGNSVQVGKRDNNKLGFRGVEDLGGGLKALFHLEIRYEPDTGTVESNSRPLFQGQSRVGLQGDFGTVRLGRGLTAFQESVIAFEPWSGQPTPAGFQTNLQVAGYTSDPLSAPGNSANRFSNALWYNTPVWGGFQLNVTVGTKDANGGPAVVGRGTLAAPQYAANSPASAYPYSVSATYTNGPIGVMVATERNAIETELWSVAASYKPIPALKLMASYQQQDQEHTVFANPETDAWLVGANYTMGPGKLLFGYGHKTPDGVAKTKQVSVGYEHNLSARTYLYADLSRRKIPVVGTPTADTNVNHFALGVHHNF